MNNVRRVLTSVMEFYSDVLSINLNGYPIPDVNKIADGAQDDTGEHISFSMCCYDVALNCCCPPTGRFLQLILGCAVNCEKKQEYIESILSMEESEQQVLMQAIQEIMILQVRNRLDRKKLEFVLLR